MAVALRSGLADRGGHLSLGGDDDNTRGSHRDGPNRDGTRRLRRRLVPRRPRHPRAGAARRGAAQRRSASIALPRLIVNLLSQRLQIEDWYRRHPEIDDEPIEAPLIGLGLPRTGSTALSFLLAEDPHARSLRRWEATQPCPPPSTVDGPGSAHRARRGGSARCRPSWRRAWPRSCRRHRPDPRSARTSWRSTSSRTTSRRSPTFRRTRSGCSTPTSRRPTRTSAAR